MKTPLYLIDIIGRMTAAFDLCLTKDGKVKGKFEAAVNYALPRGHVFYLPQMGLYGLPLYQVGKMGEAKAKRWLVWQKMDHRTEISVRKPRQMKLEKMTRMSSADFVESIVGEKMRQSAGLEDWPREDRLKAMMHIVQETLGLDFPMVRSSAFLEVVNTDTKMITGLKWEGEALLFSDNSTLQMTPEGIVRRNEYDERREEMVRMGVIFRGDAMAPIASEAGHA